jgi:hypothetical protein
MRLFLVNPKHHLRSAGCNALNCGGTRERRSEKNLLIEVLMLLYEVLHAKVMLESLPRSLPHSLPSERILKQS